MDIHCEKPNLRVHHVILLGRNFKLANNNKGIKSYQNRNIFQVIETPFVQINDQAANQSADLNLVKCLNYVSWNRNRNIKWKTSKLWICWSFFSVSRNEIFISTNFLQERNWLDSRKNISLKSLYFPTHAILNTAAILAWFKSPIHLFKRGIISKMQQ